MSTLPLVLAGPILRRVQPDSVSVWIALSEHRRVHLSVFQGRNDPIQIGEGSANPIRVLENLYIAVVSSDSGPTNNLAKSNGNEYWSYDLDIERENQFPEDWFFEATGRNIPITPERFQDLKVFHCSCRKPHGIGRDAMPLMWAIMQEEGYPHALFLTGDQIYADDVALPMLQSITRLGAELRGDSDGINQESMPVINRKTSREESLTLDALPAGFRDYLIRTQTCRTAKANCFSSKEMDSHLLGLSEFSAAYLLWWNPCLWSTVSPSELKFHEITDKLKRSSHRHVLSYLFPEGKATRDVLQWALYRDDYDVLIGPRHMEFYSTVKQKMDRFDLQHERIVEFQADMPPIRKALAYIPTYMIFDDHEITDDWYINGAWEKSAQQTQFGKSIIRNGLIAYTLFQAWGNDPALFSRAPGKSVPGNVDLLEKIPKLYPPGKGGERDPEITQAIDELLGLNSQPSSVQWHYQLELADAEVRVLDTRTQRGYPLPKSPSKLIKATALDQQLGDLTPDCPLLILVSPVPVSGFKNIEDFKKWDIWKHLVDDPTAFFDQELWSCNSSAFLDLIRRLSVVKKILVLSGDVHYGTSSVLTYRNLSGASAHECKLIQATSSASKNQSSRAEGTGANLTVTKIFRFIKNLFSDEETNILDPVIFRSESELVTQIPALIFDNETFNFSDSDSFDRLFDFGVAACIESHNNFGSIHLQEVVDDGHRRLRVHHVLHSRDTEQRHKAHMDFSPEEHLR